MLVETEWDEVNEERFGVGLTVVKQPTYQSSRHRLHIETQKG